MRGQRLLITGRPTLGAYSLLPRPTLGADPGPRLSPRAVRPSGPCYASRLLWYLLHPNLPGLFSSPLCPTRTSLLHAPCATTLCLLVSSPAHRLHSTVVVTPVCRALCTAVVAPCHCSLPLLCSESHCVHSLQTVVIRKVSIKVRNMRYGALEVTVC
jgi:hypothetical protein